MTKKWARRVDTVVALLLIFFATNMLFNQKIWCFSYWRHEITYDLIFGGGAILISAYFKPPAFFQVATAISVCLLSAFFLLLLSVTKVKHMELLALVFGLSIPFWYVGWFQAFKYAKKQKNNTKMMLIKTVTLPMISFVVPLFSLLSVNKKCRHWFFSGIVTGWEIFIIFLSWIVTFSFIGLSVGDLLIVCSDAYKVL